MDNTEDAFSDRMEPPVRPQRTRFPKETDEPAARAAEPELFDDAALPGAVLMVPNRHWGFEVVSATDHPGVCAHHQPGAADAILVQGTDAGHVRNRRGFFVVEPSAENGLHKRTAFELVPRPFRLHRLKLFFLGRHIGHLDEVTLRAIRAELARLHPEE